MHEGELWVGMATGGPRNGVKLSAPASWNGRVRNQSKDSSSTESGEFYPGRYFYDPHAAVWYWREL